jgi:hypothetical protein
MDLPKPEGLDFDDWQWDVRKRFLRAIASELGVHHDTVRE